MDRIDDGTVQVTFPEFLAGAVLGQGIDSAACRKQRLIVGFEEAKALGIEQIQAQSRIDDGPNDRDLLVAPCHLNFSCAN